jgi:multidrug resistance efflux pump
LRGESGPAAGRARLGKQNVALLRAEGLKQAPKRTAELPADTPPQAADATALVPSKDPAPAPAEVGDYELFGLEDFDDLAEEGLGQPANVPAHGLRRRGGAGGEGAGPAGRGGRGGFGGGGLGGGGLGGGSLGGGGNFGGGGGFGQGGMGGGARGEMLRAVMAGRGRGGGAGGGVAGGGGEEDRPASLRLFNPNGLLSVLAVLFWPLKFFYLLIIPAAVLAGLTAFHHWHDLISDVHRLAGELSSIAHLVIGLLIVNMGTRLTLGTAIRAAGGEVRYFGIMLVMGIIPRMFIDRSGVKALDRHGQLWAFGAPIIARLTFFAAGMILWASYRQSGSWFPDIALVVSQTGLLMFLIEGMPLLPSDGYRWLAVHLNQPNLKRKAVSTLRAKLNGRPLPRSVRPEEVPGLILFGAASVLSISGVVLCTLTFTAISLGEEFQAPAQIMFLGLCGCLLLWTFAIRARARKKHAHRRMKPEALKLVLASQPAEPELAPEHKSSPLKRGRVVWAIIGAALLAVAFLPYMYEASGTFQILPTNRVTATARTEGEVVEILVREGSWVEKDQIVAKLSSWDQQRDVDVTRAELEKAKADLAELEAGPKPEQVALAERQVDSAQSKVTFDKAQADRAAQLVKSGTISQKDWEQANTAYETDVAELNVAKANLELVKSGATDAELDAAKAEVDKLTHQLAYYEDQLERTNIRATAAGRVITPNVELLGGTWLKTGAEFLQLDDTRVVQAQIDMPETDISLIRPGDKVRVKAWSFTDREIPGTVTEVSPAAETRDYGQVVRVKASIPNADGFLRPGTSGYAKVEGLKMRVWEAYLRFIIRFFTVEVWSWIP